MPADAKWYVVHTYSGYENKVATNIEKVVENRKMHDQILEVKIPMETVTEITTAKKKVKKDVEGEENLVEENVKVEKQIERKIFPGYVFIKVAVTYDDDDQPSMSDDSWFVIRHTRGVTGFVGPGSKPVPLTEDELGIMQGESSKASFKVGDEIKIVRGTFEGYSGKIYDISEDGASVTVLVNTGKRDMPVKVESGDIKLAD